MAERLHVFDKLYRRTSNYFWTDRLRRAFSFGSMYREWLAQDEIGDFRRSFRAVCPFRPQGSRLSCPTFLLPCCPFIASPVGMSPFNAPATYNLLQYTELAQG